MAQEESWECPGTTNGKYVKGLLKDIDYWNSLQELKLKIMLINEALDIPYEKDEEIWMTGNKSRELKIIENNYTKLLNNLKHNKYIQ